MESHHVHGTSVHCHAFYPALLSQGERVYLNNEHWSGIFSPSQSRQQHSWTLWTGYFATHFQHYTSFANNSSADYPMLTADNIGSVKLLILALNRIQKITLHARLETALRLHFPYARNKKVAIDNVALLVWEKLVLKLVGPFIVSDRIDKILTTNPDDRLNSPPIDKWRNYSAP